MLRKEKCVSHFYEGLAARAFYPTPGPMEGMGPWETSAMVLDGRQESAEGSGLDILSRLRRH